MKPSSNDYTNLRIDIHSLMMELRELQPWTYLPYPAYFGVEFTGKKDIYFIYVMGGDDDPVSGFSFYKGYNALQAHLDIEKAHRDDIGVQDLMVIPQIMVIFVSPEIMPEEQMNKQNDSADSTTGDDQYFSITEIIPGRAPAYPGGESLADLRILLEQCLFVLKRAKTDHSQLYPDNNNRALYLIRKQPEKNSGNWEDRYEFPETEPDRYNHNYSLLLMKELTSAKTYPEVVQIDINMLLFPKKDERDIAYFPFSLMLVDKIKQSLLVNEELAPFPDLHSMYESIPKIVLEKLCNLPYKPARIEVRNEILYVILRSIAETAGIELKMTKKLKVLERFFRELMMKKGLGD